MESKPKQELTRIVAVDGMPAVDPSGKMNGRGVYLCKSVDCFEKARKRKAIARGLSVEAMTQEAYETLKETLKHGWQVAPEGRQ
jgi:predicted RNA-binding protein YlxR (DUF448 family)